MRQRPCVQGPISSTREYIYGKDMMVHRDNTVREHPVCVLIAIAEIFGVCFWSHDVSQANLQAVEDLMRDACVRPPDEF